MNTLFRDEPLSRELIVDQELKVRAYEMLPEIPRSGLVDVLLCHDGLNEAIDSGDRNFTLDANSSALVIADFNARGRDTVIDWEHQTLGGTYAAPNGRAPAAGWMKTLLYRKGLGLIAVVEWTDEGRRAIRSKEYRYISPVLTVRKDDGTVVRLLNAALTNDPAIRGMKPIVASRNQGKESKMEKLTELRDALCNAGATLTADAPESEILACAVERVSKPATTNADADIASAAREILGVPKTATASDTVIALSAACVRSMRSELAEKDQALADQKIHDLLAPFAAKRVIQRNTKYPTVNEDYEDMFKLAKHSWPLCERVLKSRVAMLPPQGRTEGPPEPRGNGNRISVIANAARSFEENPQTAKLTSRRAFVNDALRTADLSTLTAEEEKTLTA